MNKKELITFRCGARSKNKKHGGEHDGHRGCLMFTKTGETFEVSKPNDDAPKLFEDIVVEKLKGDYKYAWDRLGFHYAEFCGFSDAKTVNAVWDRKPLEPKEPSRIIIP